MSRSVDKRIVEMELQNKDFEAHAKESLNTISRLKKALSFQGVGEAFAFITTSARNVDLSNIAKGIDNIQKKFSALGIFGMETMRRITDAALDAGEKMWATTFGQIKSGGSARALNIANAKFKLEGLGVAWEEASKDISAAVDGTAYGFDAAANTASQLATAGIKLGESYGGMAHSLKAVSGIAAMTNSSYEEIGYIFSQIASVGHLMGQDAMQISTRGINVTATLAKQLHKTTEEIEEMQKKGEISFAMFAEAMNDAFGDQAAKANETFQGAMSNVKAALSRIGEIWYGPFYDAAIKPLNKIRELINKIKKAFSDGDDATRDFRDRLTDLMNIVSNIFSHVIGLVDTGVFNKIAEGLNNIMDKAIFVGKAWEKFLGIADETKGITNSVTGVKQSLADLSEEELALAKRVARGDFGNGAYRVQQLKKLTDNYQLVQEAVNQCVDAGWDWSVVEKKIAAEQAKINSESQSFKDKGVKLFLEMGKIVNSAFKGINNLRIAFENLAGEVIDSFLKHVSFDKIAADITNFFEILEDGTEVIKEFVSENPEMKEFLNKTWNVLENIYYVARDIAAIIGIVVTKYIKSFMRTFNFSKVRDDIFKLSVGFRTFFNNLVKQVNKLDLESMFDKTFVVFNNLYRIFSAVGSIIIGLFKAIGKVGKETFGDMADSGNLLGDISDKIATWVEDLRDWIKENDFFVVALRKTIDFLKHLPENIEKALNYVNDKIKEWTGYDVKDGLGKLIDWIGEKYDKLKENIDKYGGLIEYLKHIAEQIRDFFADIFTSQSDGSEAEGPLDNIKKVIKKILTAVLAVLVVAKIIKKVKQMIGGDEEVNKSSKLTGQIRHKRGLFGLIKDAIHNVNAIKNGVVKMNKTFETLINSGITLMRSMDVVLFAVSIKLIMDSITNLMDTFSGNRLGDLVRNVATLPFIFAMLATTVVILDTFADNMMRMTKKYKDLNNKQVNAVALMLVSIAASIWLITKTITSLSEAMGTTPEDALRVVGAWGMIELLIITMMGVLEIVGNSSHMDKLGKDTSVFLLAMAGSIWLLIGAVKKLASMNIEQIGPAFLAVIAMMGMYILLLTKMSDAASKFNYETKDIYALSLNMLAFAASMRIIAAAITSIASLNLSTEAISVSAGFLGGMMLVFAAVLAVFSKINISESVMYAFAAATVAFGVALLAIGKALDIVAKLDVGKMWSAVGAFEALFVTLAIVVGLLAYLNTSTAESVVLILGGLAATFVSFGIMFAAIAISLGIAVKLYAQAIDILVGAVEKFANADLSNLNANIDKLVSGLKNLAAGFITTAPALGLAVGIFFNTIFESIKASIYNFFMMFPTILGYYIETVFTNISTIISQTIRGIISVIMVLLDGNGEGKTLIGDLVDAIIALICAVISAVGDKADLIAETMVTATVSFIRAYAAALTAHKDELIAALSDAIDVTIEFIADAINMVETKAEAVGKGLVNAIMTGIASKAVDSYNTIKDFVDKRVKNFKDAFGLSSEDGRGSKLFKMGSNIITGFINGVKDKFTDAYNVAYSFFENFKTGIEAGLNGLGIDTVTEAGQKLLDAFIHKGLDEHSPPPETVESGEQFMNGFGIGVQNAWEKVKNVVTNIGSSAISKFTEKLGVDNIKEKLGDQFDYQSLIDDVAPEAEIDVHAVLDTDSFDKDYSDFTSQYGLGSNYTFGSSTSSGLASDISGSTYGTNGFYTGAAVDNSELTASVQDIAERIGRLEVRMDTGALVGALYAGIDEKLGEKQILAGRGVYA